MNRTKEQIKRELESQLELTQQLGDRCYELEHENKKLLEEIRISKILD